jgi:hypothetical protein
MRLSTSRACTLVCHLNTHGMTPTNTGGVYGLNAALRSSLCGLFFTSLCDVHTHLCVNKHTWPRCTLFRHVLLCVQLVFTNTHGPRYRFSESVTRQYVSELESGKGSSAEADTTEFEVSEGADQFDLMKAIAQDSPTAVKAILDQWGDLSLSAQRSVSLLPISPPAVIMNRRRCFLHQQPPPPPPPPEPP